MLSHGGDNDPKVRQFHTQVCGHDIGPQEATTLLQVNNRLVLTCCGEAGGRALHCAACTGRSGREAPGPDKTRHTLQEQRRRQRAHTLSARGDNQQGAIGQPTRWSQLHLVHSAGSHSSTRPARGRWEHHMEKEVRRLVEGLM